MQASPSAIATTSSPSPSLLSSSSSSSPHSAMLDRHPNPPRPPDFSSSRPRPRPHKPKNAPKKQPQRGLGVAQLEKLRLEEQSKSDAACLASLRHHPLQHHLLHQQQLPQPPSPLCLPLPGGKLIASPDSAPDKQPAFSLFSDFVCSSNSSNTRELSCPRALLACGKLNCANAPNSFVPLAGMAAHNLGTLLTPPHQRSAEESETCLSSLSQPHSLCSPGSAISGTISPSERSSSKKSNRLTAHETSFQPLSAPIVCSSNLPTYAPNFLRSHFQTETRQNQDLGRESGNLYVKTKGSTVSLFPGACFSAENGMEGLVGVQSAQNGATLVPFRELCLLHPATGSFDATIPSQNRLESSLVNIAPNGAQPRELSSFQTFSVLPAWSSGDQVINRKRPWVLTQEPVSNPESFKGVDLNTSADEMESETTEHNSPGTDFHGPSGVSGLTSVCRDACAYSGSPILNPGLSLSSLTEDNTRPSTLNRTCTDSKNVPEDFPTKMYLVASAAKGERSISLANGAPFLTIRKASSDNDAVYIQEAEKCGEFLTLGPSSCLSRTYGNMISGTGNSYCFPMSESRKMWHPNESATGWQPRQPFSGQAKGVTKLLPLVSNLENMDSVNTELDVQADNYCSPLQINVGLSTCVAWSKVEDHSCHLHPSAADEGPLDLELRLSL